MTESSAPLLVLTTGGTIAAVSDDATGVVPGDGVDRLTAGFSGGEIVVEQVASTTSWNLTVDDVVDIGGRAARALADGEARGVVVTHGTDTLEQSSLLVDLLHGPVTGRGPIVFTAAMRASDEPGADGPRNFAAALRVAAEPSAAGRGVLVVVDDLIHPARTVTKVHSLEPPAFRSTPWGPLGTATPDGVEWFPTNQPPSPDWPGPPERSVDVVACYPGMDPAILDRIVENGTRGLVLEGTGAGNLPGHLEPAIIGAVESGVTVVVASRCAFGGARPRYGTAGGGRTLAGLGVLTARQLGPLKARVALMALLGTVDDPEQVRTEWQNSGF
ncbi:MAG: asparaginase [Acidimicrobiales bacterium]